MRLNVYYGGGLQGFEVPDAIVVDPVMPDAPGPADDPVSLVRKAVNEPLRSATLRDFLSDDARRRVLVVVNDTHRPTPTAMMLKGILDEISWAQENRELRFLVGSGSHTPPGEDELRRIFGDELETFRTAIETHHAKDDDRLVHFGTSSRGTDLRLDKMVDWADALVILGSVEPHYFAGFTGGRKWIIGTGAYSTLEANHRHAISDDCRPMKLDGNPVHLDLVEMQAMVNKPKFGIMAVQDCDGRVLSIHAGDMTSSFEAAVDVSRRANSVQLDKRVDIVVTVARPPLDASLYQAQKAMEHGGAVVSDGGHLILIAECGDGCGPENFIDFISSGTPEEVLARVDRDYRLGYHKSARILLMVRRINVSVLTGLPEEVVRKVHMNKAEGLQEAVDKAIADIGPGATLLLLENGGVTVPRVCPDG